MTIEFVRPSKEEIRTMPIFDGPPLNNIIMVSDESELVVARDLVTGVTHIGFDTESKPTFQKGEKSKGPHVIQIATNTHALLFTPRFMPGVQLALAILQSESVAKYGFGLSGDKNLFRARFGVEIKNTIDLVPITKRVFGLKQGLGARSAVAMLFKQRLTKSAQSSNWSNYPLQVDQIKYAANDAYAGLCVANELKRRGLI
jgi:ribonuclease D